MKKLLLTVFVFSALFSNAQNCGNYYYFQNNKTITMGMFDKKGNDNGKMIYTVSNASSDSANINSEVFSSKGKSIGKGQSTIKCNNGVLMIDMKMMMPPQQQQQGPMKDASASATSSYLEYPATMNVGDKLQDGAFHITTSNGGPASSIDFTIFDRKVDSKEPVTTPAGTWDCFKITYSSKIKIKSGPFGLPAINLDVTEWYATGFGVVQSETKFGTTKIISIQ